VKLGVHCLVDREVLVTRTVFKIEYTEKEWANELSLKYIKFQEKLTIWLKRDIHAANFYSLFQWENFYRGWFCREKLPKRLFFFNNFKLNLMKNQQNLAKFIIHISYLICTWVLMGKTSVTSLFIVPKESGPGVNGGHASVFLIQSFNAT